MLRFSIVAAVLPMLMGCAVMAQAQDLNARTPDERAAIDGACTKIMGLRQGEAQYLDCQDSLAHSVARRDEAYAMAAGADDCRTRGLVPGSAALATCMLDRQGRGTAPALQPASYSSDAIEAGKSYFNVTPTVKFQRKRYACAQMGLAPNSGLFGECVASLEGALLSNPN